MNNYSKYQNLTVGLLAVVAPLFYDTIGHGVFWLLFILLVGISFCVFLRDKGEIPLSKIDVIVILYLVYGVCSSCFVRESSLDALFVYQWAFLVAVYLLSRFVAGKKVGILNFIVLAGVVQSIVGILQLNDVIQSNHRDFLLTGNFPNPGPYGGFLAISLVSAVAVFVELKRKWSKLFILLSSVLIFIMLVLVDSRAGYLALISGIVYLFSDRIKGNHRVLYGVAVAFFVVVICVALYFYRMESADARLLIWRVCANIFADHSIVGNGVGSLPSVYMNYQADFFINNPNSIFIDVANNHYQAFNEFIHVACEQGIFGLGLFIAMIVALFRANCDRGIKALLATLLVFSCFSYSADVLSLKMMFPLLIGLSVGEPLLKVPFSRWIAVIPLLLIPFAFSTQIRYKKAFDEIQQSETALLPSNFVYMLQYAKINGTIETLTNLSKNVCSSSDILCDMGDAYLSVKDTLSADSCYQRAFNMVPNRILPIYNLFLLYQGTDKAIVYAKKINEFKPKIVNSVTLRAKAQSKEYLKLNNPTHE